MKDQRARDLLSEMGKEPIAAETDASVQARRARVVPAIEAAIALSMDAKRRRSRWMRIAVPMAAAACVALAAGAALRTRQPLPAVPAAPVARAFGTDGAAFRVHVGAADLLSPSGADVAANDEVTTSPSAHARIAMGSGSTLEMGAASDVQVQDAWQATVVAGHVSVFAPELHERHVAILSLGAMIETDDLRASFDVGVDPSSRDVHVHVAEGRVKVHAGDQVVMVQAGESWPPPVVVTSTVVAPPPDLSSTKPLRPSVFAGPPAFAGNPSQLAEQNRLMQSALDAKTHGDPKRELSVLDDLLKRFPSSPLAQAARVEHFRAQDKVGQHVAAATEARAYLADYPHGFALDEASTLAK